MTGNKKTNKGFTLIEVVVTLAVFSISLLLIMGIFMMAIKAQRQSAIAQGMQSSTRFALEMMAEEIRMGTIDYGYYGDSVPAGPQDILILRDVDGNQVMFRQIESKIEMSDDSGENWAGLTPDDMAVSGLKFFISPPDNPFGPGFSVDIQPRVTIALAARNISLKVEEQTPIFLQTTVSSRVYKK